MGFVEYKVVSFSAPNKMASSKRMATMKEKKCQTKISFLKTLIKREPYLMDKFSV